MAFVRNGEAPSDLRDEERTALTYTTPVLRRDLELSGPITLRLFATATAPDFDWAVRADRRPSRRPQRVDHRRLAARVAAQGRPRALAARRGGIVRAWHPFDSPQPVPLAEPVEYLIDVIATSNVFAKGHRLRLDLVPAAAADSPRTGGAGAVTVLRDADHPSSLTVPLIPRRCGRSVPLVAEQPRVPWLRAVVERGAVGAPRAARARRVRGFAGAAAVVALLAAASRARAAGRRREAARGRSLRAGQPRRRQARADRGARSRHACGCAVATAAAGSRATTSSPRPSRAAPARRGSARTAASARRAARATGSRSAPTARTGSSSGRATAPATASAGRAGRTSSCACAPRRPRPGRRRPCGPSR